jgi:predicted transporter
MVKELLLQLRADGTGSRDLVGRFTVFQNSQSVIHEIEILGCILIAVLALGFGWLTQRRWAEQKQGRGI